MKPGSEATLGQYGAPKEFTIHTKAPGLVPGCLAKQSVLDAMKKSLEDLGVDYVCLSVDRKPSQDEHSVDEKD